MRSEAQKKADAKYELKRKGLRKEQQHQWYLQKREKLLEQARLEGRKIVNNRICKTEEEKKATRDKWRAENKEKIKSYYAKFNSKPETKTKQHIWYIKRKLKREEDKEVLQEYRNKHNQQNKKYRENNKEKVAKFKKLERKRNINTQMIYMFKRKIERKGTETKTQFTRKKLELMMDKTKGRLPNYYMIKLYVENCLKEKNVDMATKEFFKQKWLNFREKTPKHTQKDAIYFDILQGKHNKEKQELLEQEFNKLWERGICLINVDNWNKRVLEEHKSFTNYNEWEQHYQDYLSGKIQFL